MKNKVVYTCITGNYDEPINHKWRHPGYDYVCFTDNPKLLSNKYVNDWEIRSLAFQESSNVKNARWHKTHPHVLFPNYASSVWVDSNIDILTGKLFDLFDAAGDLLGPVHSQRKCIFEECDAVLRRGKDTKRNVDRIRQFLQSENMPVNYGMIETNILFRRHNNPKITKIDDMWWGMIEKFSHRDQLSFSYVIRKNGMNFSNLTFPGERNRPINYKIHKHDSYTRMFSKQRLVYAWRRFLFAVGIK